MSMAKDRTKKHNYNHLERKLGEEVWVDWDEEFGMWGVFGINSGFCYEQFGLEEDALKRAEEINRRLGATPGI